MMHQEDKVAHFKPTAAEPSLIPSFAEAEAKTASPKALRDELRAACRTPALWDVMRKYVEPPGVCGSRHFDHAWAIKELLEWDAKRNDKRIAAYGIRAIVLWRHLHPVLKQVFEMKHGVIVGPRLSYEKTTTTEDKVS